MNDAQELLRQSARRLLESGGVSLVIGWESARGGERTRPAFIRSPEEADRLVWNRHCVNSTAKYLLNYRFAAEKTAVCARGCDTRAINRMIADKQLGREQIYIIGLPCPGMENAACLRCRHRNPLVYDELIGSPAEEQDPGGRFAGVEELEALPVQERRRFWQEQFSRCIRCYACRNVCPACSCRECYADQYRTGWQGKQMNAEENRVYGLTRAYHVGDRCIECGECERVCPMGIPVMLQTGKILRDINAIYGSCECGLSSEEIPVLGSYELSDLDEFN